MTQLHAYFLLRQQQNFQRLLDGSSRGQSSSSALSSSGGKSWTRSSILSSAMSCDVNARDWLGRTVLHLACVEPSSLEYVRLLLAHPATNANLQDAESHWTALHRALFHGNIEAAVLLLKRTDVDTSLKDFEGYTAFDLYNSTLRTTKPSHLGDVSAELFTWGANRNAALGLGDGDDRTYPDQVVISSQEDPVRLKKRPLEVRFASIKVRQISMSKLHTVIVTSESSSNLRVCGFGNGGRLGPGQHTQYSPTPISQFAHTIVSVALGQDHTLAVTKSGEVLSWGLNHFSQLGYVIELHSTNGTGVSFGRSDEPIQASPRKVLGPLKKEIVKGVAACKTASACWTDHEVFTWGTNHGQLGYDKATQPVQVFPRKVTKVTHPVINITITDTALACLLDTQDVVCIWNDRYFRINFPAHGFPSDIRVVYRPSAAVNNARIAKITSCDDTFAALSISGEVFTFTVSNPTETDVSGRERAAIKPQRVWALRKQFSGVKDVALGSDGSLIVATESGHVFVRSRNTKGGQISSVKTFKFQRVPYLQRVIGVCANKTGAFGALRVDYQPDPIRVTGKTVSQHMAAIQPYLHVLDAVCGSMGRQITLKSDSASGLTSPSQGDLPATGDSVEESEDSCVQSVIKNLGRLCHLLNRDKQSRKESNGPLFGARLPYGADLIVQSGSTSEFPVHRVWLAARSPVLCRILSGTKAIQDSESKISVRLVHAKPSPLASSLARLVFTGCHAMSILILLTYLYSDELLSIWDHRVVVTLEQQLRDLKIQPARVKLELQGLARVLDLPRLVEAVQSPAQRSPAPSMAFDMQHLADIQMHSASQMRAKRSVYEPLRPDVIIQLRDKEVLCHSVILRARCLFFAGLFDDEEWTIKRWDEYDTITVDMRHMDWRVMQFPLRFIYGGYEDKDELFGTLDFINTADDLLEFMFEVIAAANELLLYRLVALCSAIILEHLTINNACYILADATHFHVNPLMHALHDYVAANMELFLEGKMLDDLPATLIKQIAEFVREQQADKFTFSRSGQILDQVMENNREWLALQDIPQPVIRTARPVTPKESPKHLPSSLGRKNRHVSAGSTMNSPTMRPLSTIRSTTSSSYPSSDEVFIMDDTDFLPTSSSESTSKPSSILMDDEAFTKPVPVWKRGSFTPRVDMKSVMAEAENSKPSNLQVPAVPYRAVTPEKTSQRERYKSYSPMPTRTTEQSKSAQSGLLRSTSSPWKLPPPPAVGSMPVLLPPPSLSKGGSKPPTTPPVTTRVTPSQSTQHGLGPVFVPSRQPSAKSGPSSIRRFSDSGVAWTLPPVQPTVESSSSGLGPSMSFMAIQQLQLDQGFAPMNDKRSLRKIQEEEQARQAEDDFLKWWAAEEERVRLELEEQIQSINQKEHAQGPKIPRGPKRQILTTARSDFSRPEGSGTGHTRRRASNDKTSGPKIKASS